MFSVFNLFYQSWLYAVEPTLRFERFSIENGLSQSNILSIAEDTKGFLWIGTWDGLNRYDGYTFKVFKNDSDDITSISDNMIFDILEDSQGFIWIATQNGLNRFDPQREQFTRFYHDENDPQSLSENWVSSLEEDKQGNLWSGTRHEGLNRFDPEKNSLFVTAMRNQTPIIL